ncbi:hypothetical protein Hesp01_52560 [Herbidospora sp. NBRC 101105]|nr:hypothetical protein Hesp01_52560 [Herbidospora sp. NBRC 101105]
MSRGIRNDNSRPDASQPPRISSTPPVTTVTHGSCPWIGAVATLITKPKTPKTVTNPAVIAADNRSARTVPPGPDTSRARKEGSMAKPHGLNAATSPAASASATPSIYRACSSTSADNSASSSGPTAEWAPPRALRIR